VSAASTATGTAAIALVTARTVVSSAWIDWLQRLDPARVVFAHDHDVWES